MFRQWQRDRFRLSGRERARRSAKERSAKRSFTSFRRLRIEPLEDRRLLAAVTVTTLNDTVDFNDGVTSLREAIFATNLVDGADTIEFAESLTSDGPATITLTQGELAITDALTINGPGAELLTIDASGNDPTPDENNGDGSRVFRVDDSIFNAEIEVEFRGLTISGGDVIDSGGGIWSRENVVVCDCVLRNNSALGQPSPEAGGGAVFQRSASLTIVRSNFAENSSLDPSTSFSALGSGGAILARDATVAIADSKISENSAKTQGGGMLLLDCDTTLYATEISHNTAINSMWLGGSGGGINSRNGTLIVDDSFLLGNMSSNGGGIVAVLTGVTIVNSQIADNVGTTGQGGGIWFIASVSRRGAGSGGVESNEENVSTPAPNSLTIDRSSIRGNMAGGDGGGVLITYSNSTPRITRIVDSTLSHNRSSRDGGGIALSGGVGSDGGAMELQLINSTISGNFADNHGGGVFLQISGATNRIVHSTITRNQSDRDLTGSGSGGGVFVQNGTTIVDHTIVAANEDYTSVANDITGFLSATLDVHYSLIGDSSGSGLTPAPVNSPDLNGNMIGGPFSSDRISPFLGPLTDNGGRTLTHGLSPLSPAIDAGNPAAMAGVNGVPSNDQRGAPFARVYGGRIDIGAFEVQPAPPALLGDYNQSGEIDAADFTVWRNSLGQSGIVPNSGRDGNGDGVVDQSDREVWAAHFGRSLTTVSAGSVLPQSIEPSISSVATFAPRSPATGSRPAVRATNGAPAVLADDHRNHALLAWLGAQPETKPDWEASPAISDVRGEKSSKEGDAIANTVDQAFAQLVSG